MRSVKHRHVKHRKCSTCGSDRPAILFPKLPNGAYGGSCQLCVDTGKDKPKPKDVIRLSGAAKKARARKQEMEKARVMA